MKEKEEPIKEKLERLEKYYGEELKRKDKLIEELRRENQVLFKSAMKSSDKIKNLTEKLEEAVKKKTKGDYNGKDA
ncbi:hypothetical protein GF336_02855 [Candidatus Woesearchaeota archaeon]|nr:hypothetical protein [Candidatus Woesearchaeota archaeon]